MVLSYKIPGGATQKTFNRKERKMNAFVKIVGVLSAVVGLIVFFGLLFSLPVMWLWNVALVPAIPGIKTITWLQAWGIMILCGFLFKPTTPSKSD